MEENQKLKITESQKIEPEDGLHLEQKIYDMSGLTLVFWGLIFTAINIRIRGFDIVPDFVGYIMLVIGLARIEKYENKFTTAKLLAGGMLFLSLFSIYQVPANQAEQSGLIDNTIYSSGVFSSVPWLSIVIMIAGLIITLYLFYYLCMGLKNLLTKVGDIVLADLCDSRWKLLLTTNAGLLCAYLLMLVYLPAGALLIMVFAVVMLVALVLLLILVQKAKDCIHQKVWKPDL